MKNEAEEKKKVIYEEASHLKVKVGQLWRCTVGNILIVAVDSCFDEFVVNATIEYRLDPEDSVKKALAPIRWQELEPYLCEVIEENVDVSEHLDSYNEWKVLAEEGKAGFWTCTPHRIIEVIRKSVHQTGND